MDGCFELFEVFSWVALDGWEFWQVVAVGLGDVEDVGGFESGESGDGDRVVFFPVVSGCFCRCGIAVLDGGLNEDSFFSLLDLSSEFFPGLVSCYVGGGWSLEVDEELVSCAVWVESRHGGEVFLEDLAVAVFEGCGELVDGRLYERSCFGLVVFFLGWSSLGWL